MSPFYAVRTVFTQSRCALSDRYRSVRWIALALATLGTAACATSGPQSKEVMARSESPLTQLVGAPDVSDEGTVLVIFGSKSCGMSTDFRDNTLPNLRLPDGLQVVHLDSRSQPVAGRWMGTPQFILFKDGTPVDFLTGVILSVNSFAPSANQDIFTDFLARNGLAQGEPWRLATTRLQNIEERVRTGGAFRHLDLRDGKLAGFQLENRAFINVRMNGVDFSGTTFSNVVFARVDTTGSNLTEDQARSIIWANSICPDGTPSRENGDRCSGHVQAGR